MKNKNNIKAIGITAIIMAPVVWLMLHPAIGAMVVTTILFLTLCYLVWCLVYATLN